MIRLYIISLSAILFGSKVFCQDTLPVIKRQISSSRFVDCYPHKNGFAALSEDGKLYQIRTSDFSDSILFSTSVSTIGTDRKGMLWAADNYSSYYSLQDTGWKWEGSLAAGKIWEIAFDTDNKPVLITDLGIYNQETEMYYGVNNHRGIRMNSFARSRYHANCFYMDDADNLWVGSNSRNSREIHVFSTRKNKFITSTMKGLRWVHYVQGIFGHHKDVFVIDLEAISGMSRLYNYSKDTMISIHHPEYDTMRFGPVRGTEDYIGAAFFDKDSKEIYYYSSLGLLKGKYNSKKRKLEKTELVMPAQCIWNGYEFEEMGFAIRLRKMFKYQGLIIYLQKEDGVFVFDGRRIINLR
ncbi:MAG: hypothetical protein ABL876_12525 [Chitinophagaceae bacterium]